MKTAGGTNTFGYGFWAVATGLVVLASVTALIIFHYATTADATSVVTMVGTVIGAVVGAAFGVHLGTVARQQKQAITPPDSKTATRATTATEPGGPGPDPMLGQLPI